VITDDRKEEIKNVIEKIVSKKNAILDDEEAQIRQRVEKIEEKRASIMEDLMMAGSKEETTDIEMAMHARALVAVLAEHRETEKAAMDDMRERMTERRGTMLEEIIGEHRAFFDTLSQEENLFAIRMFTQLSSIGAVINSLTQILQSEGNDSGLEFKMMKVKIKDRPDEDDEDDNTTAIKIKL
jgi:hypothetical protein